MKSLQLMIAVFISLLIFSSCKKSPTSTPVTPVDTTTITHFDTTVTLLGKWSIVTDSTFGVYFLNPKQPILMLVYKGVSTDYYDFGANDTLYVNEANIPDTLSYSYSNPGSFLQQMTMYRGTYLIYFGNILDLTDSSMKLELGNSYSTPEFSNYRILDLKR